MIALKIKKWNIINDYSLNEEIEGKEKIFLHKKFMQYVSQN